MKIAILVVIGLILLLGGGFLVASLGFVQVPGISPIKYPKANLASKSEVGGFIDTLAAPLHELDRRIALEANQKSTAIPPVDPTPKPDPSLGQAKIAEIWNGLEPDKLVQITAKYNEKDLANILLKMDEDQVTELLSSLPTDRATKLSQAIQQLASQPKLSKRLD